MANFVADPSTIGFITRVITSSSNLIPANIDANLLDAFAIIIVDDVMFVTNIDSAFVTVYNLVGVPIFTPINVYGPIGNIAIPTGIAVNCGPGFPIVYKNIIEPSRLIICTLDGTINGYNRTIDVLNSQILIDNSLNGSIFTGICVVRCNLYVADFSNRKILVYDQNLNPIPEYLFIDEYSVDVIPQNYSPFNIIDMGNCLFVTWALALPNGYYSKNGTGYISVFDYDGHFIKRWTSGSPLSAPYSVVWSPPVFGYPAGTILVSNMSSGNIQAYTIDGLYLGVLRDINTNPLTNIRSFAINPCYNQSLYAIGLDDLTATSYISAINIRSWTFN